VVREGLWMESSEVEPFKSLWQAKEASDEVTSSFNYLA
jgi:hypothetical protein